MSSDTFYKTVRLLGAPFRYRYAGLENIQGSPAIYAANHLGELGPIQVILTVPVRFYPWAIAEMTDVRRAPRYLYDDFIHPAWHLEGQFGMAVSAIISRLAVALINGLGCIPVDRNRGRCLWPIRSSLAMLEAGKNLLIFPEAPEKPLDPETLMRPFLCGFILLCRVYEEVTGRQLPVYPVAVSTQQRTVTIGKALFFETRGDRRGDILRTCARVEEEVHRLYKRTSSGTSS